MGFDGSSFLFWKTKKQDRLLGTGEKIKTVTEILSDCNYSNTIDFFASVHFEQLRNTLFHSAYGFSDWGLTRLKYLQKYFTSEASIYIDSISPPSPFRAL